MKTRTKPPHSRLRVRDLMVHRVTDLSGTPGHHAALVAQRALGTWAVQYWRQGS